MGRRAGASPEVLTAPLAAAGGTRSLGLASGRRGLLAFGGVLGRRHRPTVAHARVLVLGLLL